MFIYATDVVKNPHFRFEPIPLQVSLEKIVKLDTERLIH